jgi:hypothetical protein
MKYLVEVSRSNKRIGTSNEHMIDNEFSRNFRDMKTLKEWLKFHFEGMRREKIYRGEGEHTGYIYKTSEKYYDPDERKNKHYAVHWWVEISEIVKKPIIVRP